jgi:DNA-binding response OmpR family regulator
MKILIIEDEKTLCESVAAYLKKEGYVCECAYDYNKAEEKSELYNYDCIIVDITLPGGTGLDIIRKLKKSDSQAGIIIVSA